MKKKKKTFIKIKTKMKKSSQQMIFIIANYSSARSLLTLLSRVVRSRFVNRVVILLRFCALHSKYTSTGSIFNLSINYYYYNFSIIFCNLKLAKIALRFGEASIQFDSTSSEKPIDLMSFEKCSGCTQCKKSC